MKELRMRRFDDNGKYICQMEDVLATGYDPTELVKHVSARFEKTQSVKWKDLKKRLDGLSRSELILLGSGFTFTECPDVCMCCKDDKNAFGSNAEEAILEWYYTFK